MAVIAIVLGIVYGLTMPRTVTLEDSGLFLMACHFLGVAHPPGYPLYTVLGKAFELLLPFGEPALRIHCLSVFLGVGTCLELFWLARCFQMDRISAGTAALALGFSRAFWSQAQIAEVYTLNTCLFFGCAVSLVAFRTSGSTRSLMTSAALAGAGLSNHWPLFILSSPLLAGLALPAMHSLSRRWVAWIPALAAGLLPWAYLVIRSQQNPFINFYGPLVGRSAVIHFLTRQGYDDPTQMNGEWFALGPFFGGEFLRQFWLPGLAGVLVGITSAYRNWPRSFFVGSVGGFLGATVFLLILMHAKDTDLNRNIVKVFPLIPYAIAALWLGATFAEVARHKNFAKWKPAMVIGAVAVLAGQLVGNFQANNLRHYTWAREYGEAILRMAPANAIVVTHLDFDAGPVGYVRYLLGKRPDVEIMNDRELVFGNRLNNPFAPEPVRRQRWLSFVRSAGRPVAFTDIAKESVCRTLGRDAFAVIDRGLFQEFDLSRTAGTRQSSFLPDVDRYLEELQRPQPPDYWTGLVAGTVRERLHRWVETAYTQADDSWPQDRMTHWLDCLPETLEEKLRWIGARPLASADKTRLRKWIGEAFGLVTESTSAAQRAKLLNFRAVLDFEEGRDAEGENRLRESALLNPQLGENPAVFNLLQQLAQKRRKQEYGELREKLVGTRPIPDRYAARLRALDESIKAVP